MSFKDHFSAASDSYARYRPHSPKELFPYLASLSPSQTLAWDVGTGNGQAALDLAPYFEHVIATDASADQIRNATPNPKVKYEVSRAEDSNLPDRSVDLITVAQAVHWFDLDKFYTVCRRVAKPRAVIALWCYGLANISPEIDREVYDFYDRVVGGYWPPERKAIESYYHTLSFPFEEIKGPTFSMSENRTFEAWTGYVYTWSAVQHAIKALGPQVFKDFLSRLESLWGDPNTPRQCIWPLGLRIGRLA